MKILATADWHVGASPDFGNADHGPGSRLADQEQVLERIVYLAIEEHCDLFLFAGDMWHRPRPAPWEIAAAQRPLLRLAGLMPVIAIAGNTHDVVRADLPTALEVAFWDEIRVSRTPEVIPLDGVTIATLPWTPPAHLIAQRGGGDRDAIHRTVAELLLDTARGLRAECPDGAPAILTAHWSIGSAVTPTGVYTDDFRDPLIPLADLASIGFDWVAAGHIHVPQVLDADDGCGRGRIFYCGSPMVKDWGEADSEHGVWIIDTDQPHQRFVPLEDRRFVTVEWELTPDGDVLTPGGSLGRLEPEQIIGHGAAMPDVEGAVVRVIYHATPEQARRISHSSIRQALADAGAHRVAQILPDIVREDRARVQGVDETLTPAAALERWLETQDANGDRDLVREAAGLYFERAGVA